MISLKRRGIAILTTASILSLTAALMPAMASSHREAPGITKSPKVDATDFYMFRSYEPGREDYVTILANYQPLQEPGGGPNYFTMDPDAVYEIHIDNNGDAKEDLTFQFKFSTPLVNDTGITLNIGGTTNAIALRDAGPISQAPTDATRADTENYTVTLITGDRRTGSKAAVGNVTAGGNTFAKPFDNAGTKTIANYGAYANKFIYATSIPGCSAQGKVFAGQRAEAFAVNLGPIFDLVNFVPIEGDSAPGAGDGGGFPGGITQKRSNDDLYGKKNVTTLAIEVPISCLKGSGNGVIGGWTTASLPQARLLAPNATYNKPSVSGGAYTQVSRLSMPLVNELVIGLPDKDKFNASSPSGDAQFGAYVTNPTFPAIANLLFRDAVNATLHTNIADLAPTNFPRNDLVAVFLTGVPTLNQQATVTPSEMLRLNTGVAVTARANQKNLGVAGDDLAGYPNGRRPGDDTVDITLRVAMGALCHPIPINGTPTNLGVCTPAQASVGTVPFTDGAPLSARDLGNAFPYLNTPIPGSPND
ncbi:DUF4331 domain-containing protein [Asticcacaulis sp. AC460]|uniref:DUF4331 domain-containing protein n=1 Tax=Asticcacaulis sp. AC460 TaxID=1282360 RepID=UPI0004152152|nr:DUF4331 domain-containing protein [Asticcacaulis sp. AC460]